jgi:hypothetical protein
VRLPAAGEGDLDVGVTTCLSDQVEEEPAPLRVAWRSSTKLVRTPGSSAKTR